MKNLIKLLLLSAFIILSVSDSIAQLTFKSEFRSRAEARYGYRSIPDTSKDPAFFVTQRTRFGFNYKKEQFEMQVIVQDARVWGDQSIYSSTSLSGDLASIDLKEGWLNIDLNQSVSMKIGRQEWVVDDERLFSKRDWPTTGLSYDGLLLNYKLKKFQTTTALSWNNKDENVFGNDYRYFTTSYLFDTNTMTIKTQMKEVPGKIQTLNFLHFKSELSAKINISGIFVLSGWQKTGSPKGLLLKETAGTFFSYKSKNLLTELSFYYQFGKSSENKNVSAWCATASLSNSLGNFKFGAGIDYLSGNDAQNTSASYVNTEHLFDLLYGNRHRYYGHLDYFSNLDKGTRKGGLIDTYLKIGYSKNKKHDISADVHYFFLQNNVYNIANTEILQKELGLETDLYYTLNISKTANLKCGYSFYLITDSMSDLQGLSNSVSAFPQWFWLSISFKPSVLLTEN